MPSHTSCCNLICSWEGELCPQEGDNRPAVELFPLLQVCTKRLLQLGASPRGWKASCGMGKSRTGLRGRARSTWEINKLLVASKFWKRDEQANKKLAPNNWSFVRFLFFSLFLEFRLTKQFRLGRQKGNFQAHSSPKSRPDASAGYLSIKSVLYSPKYTKAFVFYFFLIEVALMGWSQGLRTETASSS